MTIKKKIQEFKRELILEEAANIFKKDGYENMKVADLAVNVGISVGSIYTLFGSKENLYHNYILDMMDHYLKILDDEIRNIQDPREKLKILTRIKFNAFQTHKNELSTVGVNHPLFFINISNSEDDAMLHVYKYIDENIMQPLKKEINTSKTSMDMTLLYDGLGVGMVKYWIITGG
jgi:AcrR family transcriptional regulator